MKKAGSSGAKGGGKRGGDPSSVTSSGLRIGRRAIALEEGKGEEKGKRGLSPFNLICLC